MGLESVCSFEMRMADALRDFGTEKLFALHGDARMRNLYARMNVVLIAEMVL